VLTRRVIVCLDVKNGRVVKGINFVGLRDVGEPADLAERYEREGADEVVFLDISATVEGRSIFLDVVRRAAERLFVPLTVGGGIRTAADGALVLRAGADKVSLNTAAVEVPDSISELSAAFGTQCVVASIDAKRDGSAWRVYTHGGTRATELEAVEWARECVKRGAGEILLTSIDRDGKRSGYDLELTRAVAAAVNVPVIASGGAGNAEHVSQVLRETGADAALLAGVLHDDVVSLSEIRYQLVLAGVPVRQPAADTSNPI
jgi:imidazole glycerol-phosphate synthase subunit HisF